MLELTPVEPDGFSAYRNLLTSLPAMFEEARKAANTESVSYRGFHVGASVMATSFELDVVTFARGANIKPNKTIETVCAEKVALNKARGAGMVQALGVLTFGSRIPNEIGTVADILTPTLHPCHRCLNDFPGDPLIRDDTLIITTGEDGVFQVFAHQELDSAYRNGNVDDLTSGHLRRGLKPRQMVRTFDQLVATQQHPAFEGNAMTPAQLAQRVIMDTHISPRARLRIA